MSIEPKPLVHLVAGLLGFTAGFADTAGFLGLDGLFTAHVTGNLVVLGAQLARQQSEGAVLRVAALPLFGVAVAVSYAFAQRARARGTSPAASLLLAESVFLAAAAIAAFALRRELAWHAGPAVAVVGILAIFGMGFQNAMMRLVYGGQTQTTVMTGNVTQLVADAAHVLATSSRSRDAEGRTDALARLRKVGVVTCGFVVGAAAGAALTRAIGVTSLALPALVVLGLALREWTRSGDAALGPAGRGG